MVIDSVTPEDRIEFGDTIEIAYTIFNDGADVNGPSPPGVVLLSYSDNKTPEEYWPEEAQELPSIPKDGSYLGTWSFTAPKPSLKVSTVVAKVVAQIETNTNPGDADPTNEKDEITFLIKKNLRN